MNKILNNWLASLADAHTPDFAECRHYLADQFPLLNAFEHTEQDPGWHAEGNVAIHTDAVLQALYALLAHEASHITGPRRQAMILAALLHDIAKPLTTGTRDIHGIRRIVAPRHEAEGRHRIAIPLMALDLDYTVVRLVMGLVGYHDWPKHLVVKNAEYGRYLQLAINVDIELLYWLEQADMRGRTCADQADQLAILEEFRLFAEDYQLWAQPNIPSIVCRDIQVKATPAQQHYVDAYALDELMNGKIALASESLARTFTPSQNYSHFYLLFGISGSGKSTWLQQQQRTDWEIISLDDIRQELNGHRGNQKNRGQMLQLAKTRLKTALAAKRDVVWDATNLRQDFRQQLTTLGRNYGALMTMVIFHLDVRQLASQNRNRPYPVPDAVLQKQLGSVQWPSAEETHHQRVIGAQGQVLYDSATERSSVHHAESVSQSHD